MAKKTPSDKQATPVADADKPEQFKIGDRSRRGMSPPVATATRKDGRKEEIVEPQAYSMGFARIEAMLEKEDPVQVGESLNKILADLVVLEENASTNKDKLAAKKAMAAVERAVDLMDYLYQTKQAMEEQARPG